MTEKTILILKRAAHS